MNPVIVQSDRSILLEVDNPLYTEARDALARFAELEKSPEHIHTYRITPLSLWNAAASGMAAEEIVDILVRYGKYELPDNVRIDIIEYVSRYGRLKLLREDDQLLLRSDDQALISEIVNHRRLKKFLLEKVDASTLIIDPAQRGLLKHALVNFGYPAEDLAGYDQGARLEFSLLDVTETGQSFGLRPYQQEAVDVFYAGGSSRGGSGVVVMPCGAGKTIVGLGIMAQLQTQTLILTPNTVAVRQWIDEILEKTSLTETEVGEYSGLVKEIRPVTISTYQIMTYRASRGEEFPHFKLFDENNWGLIIYDEVHLLPAPVFRITAGLQSRRRLGLTATLIREDERETEVFSLIGPKRYDVPWKELEKRGWIATAQCHEIRVSMSAEDRMIYALAEEREKYRIAAENELKLGIIDQILGKHPGDRILIIGQYLDQLEQVAEHFEAPLITGKTPISDRERLYESFRTGETPLLVVSKVANFAIDLPDANVAIQISGTFGSRQEEAQRLGRILRPKTDGSPAHFYSIVTRDTKDQIFAAKRQLFLTEQGYHYTIMYAKDLEKYRPDEHVEPMTCS
jgi:DNA excision repair protein ERCC-3